jgi:hypothetical protein
MSGTHKKVRRAVSKSFVCRWSARLTGASSSGQQLMIFPRLFSPGHTGRLEVRNRAAKPAVQTNPGDPPEGITDKGVEFYLARARGGFAMDGVGR